MLYKRINYFLEVANCLSFTEAAQHMYITQQAMTWQISCLEQELGVKLFIRSTRSVNLTDAGKMLRDDFTKINEEINMAVSRVRAVSDSSTAVITIGFFRSLSTIDIIRPLMNHLRNCFPDIQFDVVLAGMASLRNQLMDGNLDLCITTAHDWSSWPDVNVNVLHRYPFEVILSVEHPLAQKPELSLSDLQNETLYAIPSAGIQRRPPYWQNQIPRYKMVTLPDVSNVLINISMGHGFACLVNVFEGSSTSAFKSFPLPFEDAFADLICAVQTKRDTPLLQAIAAEISEYYN